MHGQIGERDSRIEIPRDLDFYYRTRAALLDARRGLGGGAIDYDFYRARARAERACVRRETFKSLSPYMRVLFAIAAIAAAIWMMPTRAQDCAICNARDSQTFTATP
jgi:hypothetical protein